MMCEPKDSVEAEHVLLRRVGGEEDDVKCRPCSSDEHVVPAGEKVVEMWLEVESLTPFDCQRYWFKGASVCKACYDSRDAINLHDLDTEISDLAILHFLKRGDGNIQIRCSLPDDPTLATEDHFLECPFELKDYARTIGARWNTERKKWYAPEGCNLAPFNDLAVLPLRVAEQYRRRALAQESSSARTCSDCEFDMSGEPIWKHKCIGCYSNDPTRSPSKKRKRGETDAAETSSSGSSAKSGRTCSDCEFDMSGEPIWKHKCIGCYSNDPTRSPSKKQKRGAAASSSSSAKRSGGGAHTCSDCEADMTGKPSWKRRCPSCYFKNKKK